MGLFGFGKKKKEEEKTPACCCKGACETYEAKNTDAACCGGTEDGISSIKVLGSGCKNCHALLVSTQTAVKQMGLNMEPEYVTDMEKIMGYGVMSMPALVVNEKVVSMGKVLKAADVEKLLHKHSMECGSGER